MKHVQRNTVYGFLGLLMSSASLWGADATPSSGVYVGGGAGFAMGSGKHVAETKSTSPLGTQHTQSFDKKMGKGALGTLFVGYQGMIAETDLFWAAELYGMFAPISGKATYSENNTEVSSEAKKSFAGGLALRGGHKFDEWYPYIKLALDMNRIAYNYKDVDNNARTTYTKKQSGWLPMASVGVGTEWDVGVVRLRAEYAYAMAVGKASKKIGDNVTLSMKSYKEHRLVAGVAYAF
ncbi:hypothetical protein EIL50_01870 [bacterium NHP-B]|nr:hypothetical protein EIL50_01870 [bacterium NHP-B]